jgi:hypothetical protein
MHLPSGPPPDTTYQYRSTTICSTKIPKLGVFFTVTLLALGEDMGKFSRIRFALGVILTILGTTSVAVVAIDLTRSTLALWIPLIGFGVTVVIHGLKWGNFAYGVTVAFYAAVTIWELILLRTVEPLYPFMFVVGILVLVVAVKRQ